MRIDMLQHGIRVTQIAPGLVETEFSVVRYKGDQQKADSTYENFEPLTGEDIANIVVFAANQPPHVNINDILITPTAQANSVMVHRGELK
jgi:NADP-dependent 3-hydroxy acid dehydrogenase YdfG